MDIGNKLREARQQRGLELADISRVTRIPIGALGAIERSDVARLPGGIFNRAFVRAYAVEVGLNPAEVVQNYFGECEARAEPFVDVPHVRTPDHHPSADTHTNTLQLLAVIAALVGLLSFSTFQTTVESLSASAPLDVPPPPLRLAEFRVPAPPAVEPTQSEIQARMRPPAPATPPSGVPAIENLSSMSAAEFLPPSAVTAAAGVVVPSPPVDGAPALLLNMGLEAGAGKR